jgi:hypothetical protein
MPSLNVPTHIPNQVVNKQPKLWQQALAGILAQAAGQAVSQGVGNSMSRDYAGEYGEAPASGWDAFTKGPKVSEKEHFRRQDHKNRSELTLADATLRLGERELGDIESRMGRDAANYQREMASSDRQIGDMRQITAQSKMGRRDTQDKAALQDQGQDAAMALAQLKAELDAKSPQGAQATAAARNLNASANSTEQMTQMLARRLGGGGTTETPAQPTPTDAVKKFGQGTARTPETPDPKLQQVMQALQASTAAQGQTGATTPADPRAFQMGTPQGMTEADILNRILQQLGMGSGVPAQQ